MSDLVDELCLFADAFGGALEPGDAERLVAYLDAMLAENVHVNLTAVRDRDAALALHVIDSLAAAAIPAGRTHVLDLGTGNGFPGIAVACLQPSTRVTLMDRTQKKVRAIARALEASGFDPDRVRAVAADAAQAHAHGYAATFDAIVCRAVAAPVEVGRIAAPLLTRDGSLWLWLAEDAEAPDELPGKLSFCDVIDYDLPEPADRRRRIAQYDRD